MNRSITYLYRNVQNHKFHLTLPSHTHTHTHTIVNNVDRWHFVSSNYELYLISRIMYVPFMLKYVVAHFRKKKKKNKQVLDLGTSPFLERGLVSIQCSWGESLWYLCQLILLSPSSQTNLVWWIGYDNVIAKVLYIRCSLFSMLLRGTLLALKESHMPITGLMRHNGKVWGLLINVFNKWCQKWRIYRY